ncbi:SPASM domain-containing protein [Ruminococcaceae bacterium OttesenSCG-928-A11]|nr:SPASM domain-containing protein [Ruminococcaceae bacterium OttesenSCG-928-A11]
MGTVFNAVEIEVNSHCNRKCWYCPSGRKERVEQGEMSVELFETLMLQLRNIGYSGRVNFNFFGEPLLCNNLDHFVKSTRLNLPNAYLFLASNGDYLDQKRIEELIQAGIDMFNVTQHCGTESMFTRVFPDIPEDIKSKIYYRNYTDIRLHNRSGIIDELQREGMEQQPCHLPSEQVIITVLGNVLPCCDDFDQKNVMGNITETNLVDIWNSSKFNTFRENLLAGNRAYYDACKMCDHIS